MAAAERIYDQVLGGRETYTETVIGAESRRMRMVSKSWQEETHYAERGPGTTPEDSEIYQGKGPMRTDSAAQSSPIPRLSGESSAEADA